MASRWFVDPCSRHLVVVAMVLLVLVFVLGGWCWCFDFLELVVWSLMAFQVEDFALGASWPAFQGAFCWHPSDRAMLRTLGFLA